jgi:hypothetical protein
MAEKDRNSFHRDTRQKQFYRERVAETMRVTIGHVRQLEKLS